MIAKQAKSCFDETTLRSPSGISVQQNAGGTLCPAKVAWRGQDAAMEDRLLGDGNRAFGGSIA